MSSSSSNNKRIAKNTIFLYIRTAIVLLVSLYTSRVVLRVLGVENLGIYNVVGGIVAMMGFFQSAQTKATSRFITYELGRKGDQATLRRVFSVCMTIHVLIASIGLIIGETLGVWIITHWTSIPEGRLDAAMLVYQFALAVFCIQIIRVPYDSVIVAHEHMSMFAYLSVLEAVLQLGVVYALMTISGDSLIYYSAFTAFVALVIYLFYYLYVRLKFKAYRFEFVWDKDYSRRILSFSGWTLLGTGANTATQQGVNLLMNNYVGLVANAALGLAGQVNNAVSRFVSGFSTAFTPQIIKLYAQKDYAQLHVLMNRSSKFSFALCYIFALPLMANMGLILSLWLGNEVPMFTKEFCQLILACTIIDATTGVYNTAITATGKVKGYQLAISLSFLFDLVCSFVLLLCHVNPVYVFGSRIATRGFVNMFIGLYFIRKYVEFDVASYFRSVIIKIVITLLITILPVYFIALVTEGWLRLIVTIIVSVALVSLSTFCVLMTESERKTIMSQIFLRREVER